MVISPTSSPWAPAPGDMATPGIPVSVFSQWAQVWMTSNAPWTVETGCSGCRSPRPGMRATFSLRRGLCFIVHEPSG